jgi:CRP/FNR family transcriptional regulator, cyclic AMP receptor protein
MKPIEESKIDRAVYEFLLNFPFFSRLAEEELSIVSEHIQFIEIEKDELLFKEGDEGDAVYFVLEGELDVMKGSVSGKKVGIDQVVIATLSKGCSVGEMSMIDKIPRSATVRAREKSTLVTLKRKGFDLIIEEYPRIGTKILIGLARLLSKNLRKTSGRLADYTLIKHY